MTNEKKQPIWIASIGIRRRPTLPGRVQPSTIGAEGLNFCVRYGNRWNPFAIATGNCSIFLGPRSVIIHSSYLPKVSFCPLEVFLFLEAFASTLRAAHPSRLNPSGSIKFNACCAFTLCYSRPLSHLDNCTVKKIIFSSLGPFSSQTLKSSPRPISIIKLHKLPYFHR